MKTFPVLPILGLIFIVLKLTNYIDWSWWWVLAPFWGGIAVLLAFYAVIALIALIVVRS